MKSISGLSSIVLITILNTAPCLALNQPISLNDRLNPTSGEAKGKGKVLISGLFDEIKKGVDIINKQQTQQQQEKKAEQDRTDRLNREERQADERAQARIDRLKREDRATYEREVNRLDRLNREERLADERKGLLEFKKEQQARIDLARKEASEKERIEADRNHKYFLSLSPTEQKRYKLNQQILWEKDQDRKAQIFIETIRFFSR